MEIATKQMLVPVLRFPEFDEDWRPKKISDISKLSSSKRVYLTDYVEKGIPFYRGKEISELKAGKIPNDILYITESSYNEFREKYGVPEENDILITAVGTLGNVLRIKNNDKFYFKDGNLIWFKKITEHPAFLEILLEYSKRKIEKSSIGSTQRALTMVELNKLSFNFPQLPEQQKIASFLTKVDDKIAQLTKKAELLEQYKKGVMQQIFKQELRFKDENGNDFPKWEKKKLGELMQQRNTQAPKSEQYPLMAFIANKGVAEKGERYNREFLVNDGDNKKYKQTEKGDFIYSSNNLETGSIGLNNYGNACISPVYSIFKFSEDSDTIFMSSYLVRKMFIYKMVKFRQGVVYGQWRIHESDFLKIEDEFPCKEEQTKIANFLQAIDKKIEQVNNQLTLVKTWKKGLLQKMFV